MAYSFKLNCLGSFCIFHIILVSSFPQSDFYYDDYDALENNDFPTEDYYEEDNFGTLILSHVIFRHGNRTPDSFQELYPNDPYLNKTYYPYGLGQLTNAGKFREYTVGTTLRERYNHFINKTFLPDEVEATSTDTNRTKASLELVLAGLFPPSKDQIWNQHLMWQPVPYNYIPQNRDRVLMGIQCPYYLKLYQKVEQSIEMRQRVKKYQKVFDYINRFSGLNARTFQNVYNLYFGLSTEEEYGLRLPSWTKKVWPEMITNLAINEYYILTANTDMRKMASGYLLRKILDDTEAKITNRDIKRKIHFYSAHENTVAQFLILLNIFKPHVPNYGSHILVEVHKVGSIMGIKVFYQNWDTPIPQVMRIPNCGEFCPFSKFKLLYHKYLPDDRLCGN